MSDRKFRLVAQNNTLTPQLNDNTSGDVNCTGQPGGAVSAEENLRLIKAFSVIADNRRRAWLVQLVEHFAGLESVPR